MLFEGVQVQIVGAYRGETCDTFRRVLDGYSQRMPGRTEDAEIDNEGWLEY